MSESGRETGENPHPLGSADATGYRRPFPARAGAGTGAAPFSTNPAPFSANRPGGSGSGRDDGVSNGMDRILPGSKRRLADWPLAIKTILAFWAFYFVMTSTRAMLIDLPGQGEALRRRVGVMLVAATLTWLIYLLLKRFDRASIQVKIVAAATAALPASMLLATVNHYAFYVYSPLDAAWISEGMERRGGWSVFKIISESTHSWYFFFAAWAAIFIALSYARQLREADQRAAILVREAQEAQLRALRYQINPHFLFNTLNSLSALVLAQRNDAAERMLMNLSAFFRTTLAADPTADVPLAEEI